MSFLVTAALAIGLLIALPAIAHFLRSGRAVVKPFPPAAWCSRPHRRTQRTPAGRRLLLALRALAVLMLALVGATTFVSCSRLSLARGAALRLPWPWCSTTRSACAPRRAGGPPASSALAKRRASCSIREPRATRCRSCSPAPRGSRWCHHRSAAVRPHAERARSERSRDRSRRRLVLSRGSLRDAERRELRVVVLSEFAGPPLADTAGVSHRPE